MEEITKAVIPLGGLGTRFLPFSKILPKEFFPLVDKPLLYYALEELKQSGAKEIIFVVNSHNRRLIGEYLKRNIVLEKILDAQKKTDLLEELKKIDKLSQGLTFLYAQQTKPLGDGHALLQAQKLIGEEPCYVVYPDDVIYSAIPCSLQLAKVFKTAQKTVQALFRLPKESLPSYGVVGAEKIANRLYKIKKIVEKPSPDLLPSDLAVVGRRIITSEVFDYLKQARPNKKGEIVLSEVLDVMVKDGKIVYGYEIEGRWLECGDKKAWLRSQLYLTLRHPEYGSVMQKFLKEEKLL